MNSSQENLISFSNSLEDQIFEIVSFSLQENNKESYYVSLLSKSNQLQCVFTDSAAKEITNKNVKQGSNIKVVKYNAESLEEGDIVVNQIKVWKTQTNSLKVPLNFVQEFSSILKFLLGANKGGFDLGKIEKKFQELKQLYPYSFTITSFSGSAAMGFLSASLISKTIKSMSLIIVAYLLSLQTLSANGIINVNWGKAKKIFEICSVHRLFEIFGMSSLGFSLGFYLGMRKELNKVF